MYSSLKAAYFAVDFLSMRNPFAVTRFPATTMLHIDQIYSANGD